jgi:hypothetical protein
MRYTKEQMRRYVRLCDRLAEHHLTSDDVDDLLRCERALRRWSEQECGDSNDYCSWVIEWDEDTNTPYRCTYPHGSNKVHRVRIPDREKGALKRAAKIAAKANPPLRVYHQSDPRGCQLYLLPDSISDEAASSTYTNGIGVWV